jgi:hypothetical protein
MSASDNLITVASPILFPVLSENEAKATSRCYSGD